jgi:hypothetical protein
VIDSKLGEGSSFTVLLPPAPTEAGGKSELTPAVTEML